MTPKARKRLTGFIASVAGAVTFTVIAVHEALGTGAWGWTVLASFMSLVWITMTVSAFRELTRS